MENISLVKRAYYRYLGTMYWLIHWTDTHRLLGLRPSSLIRLLSLLLLIVALIRSWNQAGLVAVSLLFIWIQLSYWRGRRSGYYRFVVGNVDLRSSSEIKPIKPNIHVPVFASGIFSLRNWESNVIYLPAEYWQVPLGDHAVMVLYEPGRFLYQFVSIKSMQDLQKGWLLFGSKPRPALSISFLSTWGPEFDDVNISMLGINRKNPEEKLRTIYLSFESDEDEEAVWQNLLFDARRIRSDQEY